MKWISVKDQMPVDDRIVLAFMCKFGNVKKAGSVYLMAYVDNCRWEMDSDLSGKDAENNPDYWMVTHWIDIPATPTE